MGTRDRAGNVCRMPRRGAGCTIRPTIQRAWAPASAVRAVGSSTAIRGTIGVLVALLAAASAASPASAGSPASAASPTSADALTFTPCQRSPGFSCAFLSVPLDRSGATAGTVTLSVERLQSGTTPSRDAVLALAGGPGQAATPLAQDMAAALAPALAGRDLIVFDQRGTGSSGPLRCAALEGLEHLATIGALFERCARQIGAARGAYTTQESVADIEAIRQALGYEKLVLSGVSYGTKVALEYAERYPGNVEALVLDSVVPSSAADPFNTATFAALGPVLGELCGAGACSGITTNELGDVAQLATRLRKHSLKGAVFDGSGRRHAAALSDVDLFNLIVAGDLNPTLRALLPASVRSALNGDAAPLLRLHLLSEGLIPLPGARLASANGIDEALAMDTTCEEALFPWQRSAPARTRRSEALGALHSLPRGDFYPFGPSVAWQASPAQGCAYWPSVAPPPPGAGVLPDVPALILSGAQDLRTPTSGARLVAQRIPGAALVVVPHTGHSVLGSDFSGCAEAALRSFFEGAGVQPCGSTPNPFAPTPIVPSRLASVQAVGGVPGRPGRTLAVVLETIVDLEEQAIGAALQATGELPSGSSFGGLRGGYARIESSRLILRGLSFVPGVRLTGTFPIREGHLGSAVLRVQGRAAARGTIRLGGGTRASGTLGGRRFNVDLAKVRLSRRGGVEERRPSLSLRFRAPGLARIP